MRKLWILLFLFVLGLPAQAQTTWEAAFYVEHSTAPYSAEIRLFRSDGEVTVMPLPANFSQGANTAPFRQVIISDDRRYAVMSEYQEEPFAARPLQILDLQSGRCCLEVSPIDGMLAYDFAGFEPNGSRFAFSYVAGDPSTNTVPFLGGLMIVDAATGEVITNSNIRDVALANGMPEHTAWALMGDWTQDGILFADNCYACEGRFDGQYALWQPDTGGFIANPGISFSSFGTRLDATGEFLLAVQNRAFPFDPTPGMLPIPNVIHYTPAGGDVNFSVSQDDPNAPVVYFNIDAVSINRVHWVADGQAFLVAPNNAAFWDVTYRDGQVERFGLDGFENSQVLAGTPDGWLSLVTDANGNQVIVNHNITNDTQTTIFSVDTDATITLIDAPQLGLSLPQNPPVFPFITAPSADARATMEAGMGMSCVGLMPTRLVVGQQGRVTPGDPNRMRSNPSTNSEIVGQIPGEGVFNVINGPVCDTADGIVWWQVEYDGGVGWTAEGQGGEYWTEPLNR
jgi:hypothetical protein